MKPEDQPMTAATHQRHDTPPSRLTRFLLSIMGPPAVGDLDAPPTFTVTREAEFCAKCGQPYDTHSRVYANVTYLTCPPAA